MASNADLARLWNDEEDMILVHVYIEFHHSTDHKSRSYWHTFVEAFNKGVSNDKKRSFVDVHARFCHIKTNVEMFHGIYVKIEEQSPRDGEDALLAAAKQRFQSTFGRDFAHENIWNLWKYAPFW